MSNDRFASAHEMVREYAELEAKMADHLFTKIKLMLASSDDVTPSLVQSLQGSKLGNHLKMIC